MNNNNRVSGFSKLALSIGDSITHGTRALIEKLNANQTPENKIIDLSIGTLDEETDVSIDNGVIDFIKNKPEIIHQFAPVKGFDFLLQSIAQRIERLHNIKFDPATEIMVTPGGIKGSIAVVLHTLLNPEDEVILPLPNWPHYADMIKIHHGKTIFIASESLEDGLRPLDLHNAINEKTKLVILGDCINPTGKVYTTAELLEISTVIANHNITRAAQGLNPIFVLYDCPYEAHIFQDKSQPLASITINGYNMRECVITVTGPGKTYGMHGDRIGYICANPNFIEIAARVQANLNSFASTYAQIACFYATHAIMDAVVARRSLNARKNLLQMVNLLKSCGLQINIPQGGYFLFVNFSAYATYYQALGFERADQFLLEKATVATISGMHFAEGYSKASDFKNYVRINCGRNSEVLAKAFARIKNSLEEISSNAAIVS